MRDNKQHLKTMVLPRVLVNQVLRLFHEELGHSGTTRLHNVNHEGVLLERSTDRCQ